MRPSQLHIVKVIGYSSGLQSLISSPGSSGMVMGFDINGVSSIPAGYPGDGGNEGNLLAVLVLNLTVYRFRR